MKINSRTVYSGKLGEALYINSSGAAFRGNIGNLGQFGRGENGALVPVIANLRKI
jgi:hypothetical protein